MTLATIWPNLPTPAGTPAKAATWAEIFEWFEREPPVFTGTMRHGGWSAAVFEPCHRALENVQHVTALVLDYDGTTTIEAALESWAGTSGLMHTSKGHTAESHRFRLVLPLSRPVTPFEYAGLWRRAAAHTGWKVDEKAKDAARFWFLPCRIEGGPYETQRLDGDRMNPGEWLLRPEPPTSAEDAATRPPPRVRTQFTDEHEQIMRRASAYLAKMPPAIAGSGGHQSTWNAAVALRGFGLNEPEILDMLRSEYNPRCEPPWSERELAHKAKDAAKARVPAGFKLDDERDDWRTYRERYKRPPVDLSGAKDPDPDYVPDPPEDYAESDGEPSEEPMREPGDDTDEPASRLARWGVTTVREAFVNVLGRAQSVEKSRGFTTGHFELDEWLGGIRKGMALTVGAMTSWGKSSFALMVFDENDQRGVRAMFVTFEDSVELLENRLAARRAQVDAVRLRDGEVTDDEVRKLERIEREASERPFVFDARGKHAEDVARGIVEMIRGEGIELVIVDYLQKARMRRALDRRNEVTEVGVVLSNAIKTNGAACLMLSQLSRPEGKSMNYVPNRFDLKESGDIENESDHIVLGFWKDHGTENQKRCCIIDKNKDGPVPSDDILLPFNEETASFITREGKVFRKPRVTSEYDHLTDFSDNYSERVAP